MQSKYRRAVAISSTKSNSLVGMGVVVDDGRYVITCAHVINVAMDRDDDDQAAPDALITVHFILCEHEFTRQGKVVKWYPPDSDGSPEDLALLELDRPIDIVLDDVVFVVPRIDELVRAYGMPDGSTLGVWWQGWMSYPVRRQRFQLEQADRAPALERGFSGSPLLSSNGEKIYGIVSRVRKSVGYMIPTQELDLAHKILLVDVDDAESDDCEDAFNWRADGRTAVVTATATEKQDSLIEVEVNADYGSFSDEDAFYFKRIIELLIGRPNAKLTISYIRRGSAFIVFNVSSENTEDREIILSAINDGALERHGILRANIAEYVNVHEVSQSIAPTEYVNRKEVLDRCVSAILLVIGLPLIWILAILIRLTSPGPATYRQSRVGKEVRIFTMYKLRTMRLDAESYTGVVWTQRHDPRITWLGRILRKLHLDEFPQLLNVLKGEMAIIGPRPERPEFTERLAHVVPGYLDRLTVRPGIAGLAQVNLPPDTDLESVRKKVLLDRYYIEHASFILDLKVYADIFLRLLGLRPILTRRIAEEALKSGR